MPGRDGTGPIGRTAMGGHAAGTCAGAGMPGSANPAPGTGFGMGFGRGRGFGGKGGGGGRGWRHIFHATGLPGWMRFGGDAAPYRNPDPGLEKGRDPDTSPSSPGTAHCQLSCNSILLKSYRREDTSLVHLLHPFRRVSRWQHLSSIDVSAVTRSSRNWKWIRSLRVNSS